MRSREEFIINGVAEIIIFGLKFNKACVIKSPALISLFKIWEKSNNLIRKCDMEIDKEGVRKIIEGKLDPDPDRDLIICNEIAKQITEHSAELIKAKGVK